MRTYGLAGIAPPAVGKEAVTVSRLDERGVLEGTPGQLGEGLAVGENALGLHLEATLLGHGSIPTAFEKMLRRFSLI